MVRENSTISFDCNDFSNDDKGNKVNVEVSAEVSAGVAPTHTPHSSHFINNFNSTTIYYITSATQTINVIYKLILYFINITLCHNNISL